MKKPGNRKQWWLHNMVTVINATEIKTNQQEGIISKKPKTAHIWHRTSTLRNLNTGSTLIRNICTKMATGRTLAKSVRPQDRTPFSSRRPTSENTSYQQPVQRDPTCAKTACLHTCKGSNQNTHSCNRGGENYGWFRAPPIVYWQATLLSFNKGMKTCFLLHKFLQNLVFPTRTFRKNHKDIVI